MLDIRLIRRDPDAVRAALAGAGPAPRRRSTACSSSTSAGAALTAELEQLRAEQNAASKALKGAPTPEQREQLAALAARGRALSDEETPLRAERDAALASLPNLPPTTRPTRTRSCARSARRAHRPRPPGAGRPADRHGARRAAVGLALRVPARRAGDAGAGARPLRDGEADRRGVRAGDPAGAGPRAGAVRDRLPARHRAADLPPARRRSLPGRHLRGRAGVAAPRRDPRRRGAARCATPASPAASGARPAPPARTRAASSACTSSTRSRCSASSSPTGRVDEHERLLAIEESIMHELEIPYRVVAIAVDDLGASAAKKYDFEAWLPGQGRYRELTSCSNTTDYQARRLDIRYRPAGRPARPTWPRSTGPRSRSGGRSSRCWRTASSATARWGCRPALTGFGAPAVAGRRRLDCDRYTVSGVHRQSRKSTLQFRPIPGTRRDKSCVTKAHRSYTKQHGRTRGRGLREAERG